MSCDQIIGIHVCCDQFETIMCEPCNSGADFSSSTKAANDWQICAGGITNAKGMKEVAPALAAIAATCLEVANDFKSLGGTTQSNGTSTVGGQACS